MAGPYEPPSTPPSPGSPKEFPDPDRPGHRRWRTAGPAPIPAPLSELTALTPSTASNRLEWISSEGRTYPPWGELERLLPAMAITVTNPLTGGSGANPTAHGRILERPRESRCPATSARSRRLGRPYHPRTGGSHGEQPHLPVLTVPRHRPAGRKPGSTRLIPLPDRAGTAARKPAEYQPTPDASKVKGLLPEPSPRGPGLGQSSLCNRAERPRWRPVVRASYIGSGRPRNLPPARARRACTADTQPDAPRAGLAGHSAPGDPPNGLSHRRARRGLTTGPPRSAGTSRHAGLRLPTTGGELRNAAGSSLALPGHGRGSPRGLMRARRSDSWW